MTHDDDWRIVLGGVTAEEAMSEYARYGKPGETLAAWLERMAAELWPDEREDLDAAAIAPGGRATAIAAMARRLERDAGHE